MDPDEIMRELYGRVFPLLPEFEIVPERTALLTIDMQYLDAHADYGLGRRAKERGEWELIREYFEEVDKIIPKIQDLQGLCRRTGIEPIHVCISPNTLDARDCPTITRMLKIRPPKGTRDTEILDELKPQGDEIMLTKITSSAFNSTTLNLILHNLGVDTLIMCGVITNGCVESTVRDARDLGFKPIVVGDACATWTRDLHERSLIWMKGSFGNVRTTAEVMEQIETAAAATATH